MLLCCYLTLKWLSTFDIDVAVNKLSTSTLISTPHRHRRSSLRNFRRRNCDKHISAKVQQTLFSSALEVKQIGQLFENRSFELHHNDDELTIHLRNEKLFYNYQDGWRHCQKHMCEHIQPMFWRHRFQIPGSLQFELLSTFAKLISTSHLFWSTWHTNRREKALQRISLKKI